MVRAKLICTLILLGGSCLLAQDGAKLKSGPKPGASMPAPFECILVNRFTYKDEKKKDGEKENRRYCMVCTFGLNPSVLIFTKEPAAGKGEAFTDLLRKLDEIATEFSERTLSVGVVIVSPDARDSTNNPQAGTVEELTKDTEKGSEEADKRITDETKKLIDEAVKRAELQKRLTKRADGLKHVIVGFVPENPKGYDLNAKADMTVIFYERMKVIETFAYGPGTLEEMDVKTIVNRVRDELSMKKKPADEKKAG